MSKLERKIRRNLTKQKKKTAEKEMAEKVSLFGSLPDYCLICEKFFDKKNKEMVQSWYVVVREQEKKTNLYCPECWNSAIERIKQIEQQIKEEKDDS